jgi:hypothetical protein
MGSDLMCMKCFVHGPLRAEAHDSLLPLNSKTRRAVKLPSETLVQHPIVRESHEVE